MSILLEVEPNGTVQIRTYHEAQKKLHQPGAPHLDIEEKLGEIILMGEDVLCRIVEEENREELQNRIKNILKHILKEIEKAQDPQEAANTMGMVGTESSTHGNDPIDPISPFIEQLSNLATLNMQDPKVIEGITVMVESLEQTINVINQGCWVLTLNREYTLDLVKNSVHVLQKSQELLFSSVSRTIYKIFHESPPAWIDKFLEAFKDCCYLKLEMKLSDLVSSNETEESKDPNVTVKILGSWEIADSSTESLTLEQTKQKLALEERTFSPEIYSELVKLRGYGSDTGQVLEVRKMRSPLTGSGQKESKTITVPEPKTILAKKSCLDLMAMLYHLLQSYIHKPLLDKLNPVLMKYICTSHHTLDTEISEVVSSLITVINSSTKSSIVLNSVKYLKVLLSKNQIIQTQIENCVKSLSEIRSLSCEELEDIKIIRQHINEEFKPEILSSDFVMRFKDVIDKQKSERDPAKENRELILKPETLLKLREERKREHLIENSCYLSDLAEIYFNKYRNTADVEFRLKDCLMSVGSSISSQMSNKDKYHLLSEVISLYTQMYGRWRYLLMSHALYITCGIFNEERKDEYLNNAITVHTETTKNIDTQTLKDEINGDYNNCQHSLDELKQILDEMMTDKRFSEVECLLKRSLYLNSLASLKSKQSKYAEFLSIALESLSIHHKIYGSSVCNVNISGTLNNIALSYHQLGKYEQGLHYYLQSLDMFYKIHGVDCNNEGVAVTLMNIGCVYRDMNDYESSLDYLTCSYNMFCVIYKQTSHPAITCSYNIARCYFKQHKYESALEWWMKALSVYKSQSDNDVNKSKYAECLYQLGLCYYQLCQYDESVKFYSKSYDMNVSINNGGEFSKSMICTLSRLADVYYKTDHYNEGVIWFRKFSELFHSLSDISTEDKSKVKSICLHNIAVCYKRLNDERSADYFNQSTELYHGIIGFDYISTANMFELDSAGKLALDFQSVLPPKEAAAAIRDKPETTDIHKLMSFYQRSFYVSYQFLE